MACLTCAVVVRAAEPLPTNHDPGRQIRFNTADQADAHRERLIRFIWTDGLPTDALPTVTRDVTNSGEPNSDEPNSDEPSSDETAAKDLAQIDHTLVARIDRLVVEVSGWDFFSTTYLLHPQNDQHADRLVVVHQGHAADLGGGVADTANFLLAAGFTVAVSHMPLSGWNDDVDGTLDDGTTFDVSKRGTSGHNDLFDALAGKVNGGTFRLFLEPVVQTINQFIADVPDHGDIAMIGLSGGGWTTHMVAAVDTRIRVSVPVAGSSPLYMRNEDAGSRGDAEQVYAPLYDENIAEDGSGGGVATWLEIYALGGYGPGCEPMGLQQKDRQQTMVTNEHDTCCFSKHFADSFKQIVEHHVEGELGRGGWAHVLDSSHHEHKISEPTRRDVIAPLLGL